MKENCKTCILQGDCDFHFSVRKRNGQYYCNQWYPKPEVVKKTSSQEDGVLTGITLNKAKNEINSYLH